MVWVQKPTVAKLVKKFAALYGTENCIKIKLALINNTVIWSG